jgi:hypothetical protein
VLLLRDLVKHTSKQHPDFENLEKALALISKVTEDNNLKLDKVMNNRKLFELQRVYGRPNNLELVDSKREYITEELMQLFWGNGEKSVMVYFLTDLLVVTERCVGKGECQYTLISAMQLSGDSICKEVPDTQYFSNLFTVHGDNDTLTFIESSPEQKQRRKGLIDTIIIDLREKQYFIDKIENIFS